MPWKIHVSIKLERGRKSLGEVSKIVEVPFVPCVGTTLALCRSSKVNSVFLLTVERLIWREKNDTDPMSVYGTIRVDKHDVYELRCFKEASDWEKIGGTLNNI